jgi:hypothetical protein
MIQHFPELLLVCGTCGKDTEVTVNPILNPNPILNSNLNPSPILNPILNPNLNPNHILNPNLNPNSIINPNPIPYPSLKDTEVTVNSRARVRHRKNNLLRKFSLHNRF